MFYWPPFYLLPAPIQVSYSQKPTPNHPPIISLKQIYLLKYKPPIYPFFRNIDQFFQRIKEQFHWLAMAEAGEFFHPVSALCQIIHLPIWNLFLQIMLFFPIIEINNFRIASTVEQFYPVMFKFADIPDFVFWNVINCQICLHCFHFHIEE